MATRRKPTTPDLGPWKNRIVGLDYVAPDQLLANPLNARRHPAAQRDALRAVLDDIGWLGVVIVNTRTGNMIDGHARVEEALTADAPAVPVLYVDLDESEERLALASFDAIGDLAVYDPEVWEQLRSGINVDGVLADLLSQVVTTPAGLPGSGDDPAPKPLSLVERFGVPPFSVLDARQGYWTERKRTWLDLGIVSDLGRGEDLAYAGGSVDQFRADLGDGKKAKAVTISSLSGRVPDYYEQKRAAEAKVGRTLGNAEFERDYLVIPDGTGLSSSGTSTFDPVLAELAYRWFTPPNGRILDPFAGGSVRGLVAAALGRHYVGIDLSKAQVEADRQQWDEISPLLPAGSPAPTWIVGDSRAVLAGTKRVKGLPATVDFVFSCPPYADLEVYSDDPADLSNMPYPAFVEAYRAIIASACDRLADDRFAAFVVGEVRDKAGIYRNFVGDTIAAFVDAGLGFYNEAILVTSVGSLPIRVGRQFEVSRKLGKTHQNVLVFVKGDPKAAVGALGYDVEYGETEVVE